jgi:hypothetical protein
MKQDMICRHCGEPYDPKTVERVYGSLSPILANGYCSAACYTQVMIKQPPTPSNASLSECKEGFTCGEWVIKSKDGHRMTRVETNDVDCKTICDCYNDEVKPYERIPIEEAEANAALIAESKNLYNELKEILLYTKVKDGLAEFKTSEAKINELKAIINRINKH